MTVKHEYFKTLAKKYGATVEDVYTVYYGEESLQDKKLQRSIIEEFTRDNNVMFFAIVWKGHPFPGTLSNIHYYDFIGQVMEGLNLSLHKTEYTAQFFPSNSLIADEAYFQRLFSKRKNAGIFVLVAEDIDIIQKVCFEFDNPHVLLHAPINIDIEKHYMIRVDDKRIVANNVSYLYELGHRRIAHIHGVLNDESTFARRDGYYQGLIDVGLEMDDSLLVGGNWREDGGYDATQKLLSLDEPPSAIISANDRMAIGVIRAIHNASLRVPDDISVIGIDDIAAAMQTEPSLSTVRIPMTKMGRVAGRTMLELLEGKEVNPRHQYLVTELIIRDSTSVAKNR